MDRWLDAPFLPTERVGWGPKRRVFIPPHAATALSNSILPDEASITPSKQKLPALPNGSRKLHGNGPPRKARKARSASGSSDENGWTTLSDAVLEHLPLSLKATIPRLQRQHQHRVKLKSVTTYLSEPVAREEDPRSLVVLRQHAVVAARRLNNIMRASALRVQRWYRGMNLLIVVLTHQWKHIFNSFAGHRVRKQLRELQALTTNIAKVFRCV